MERRARILAFGAAAVLVAAGALSAVLVGGLTGDVLTILLLSAGLGGAVLLAFLEVGLSEDREHAREDERRGERARRQARERRSARLRRPRRPRRPG